MHKISPLALFAGTAELSLTVGLTGILKMTRIQIHIAAYYWDIKPKCQQRSKFSMITLIRFCTQKQCKQSDLLKIKFFVRQWDHRTALFLALYCRCFFLDESFLMQVKHSPNETPC